MSLPQLLGSSVFISSLPPSLHCQPACVLHSDAGPLSARGKLGTSGDRWIRWHRKRTDPRGEGHLKGGVRGETVTEPDRPSTHVAHSTLSRPGRPPVFGSRSRCAECFQWLPVILRSRPSCPSGHAVLCCHRVYVTPWPLTAGAFSPCPHLSASSPLPPHQPRVRSQPRQPVHVETLPEAPSMALFLSSVPSWISAGRNG